jgi:hypothetical protein
VKQPAVYMLASEQNGTLKIGVTSNLIGLEGAVRHWIPAFAGMTEMDLPNSH